jgi:predicted nucleic acid-binding protein
MTTFSLDTNILIALWDTSNSLNVQAQGCLERARKRGELVVSAPVYGELMAHPARTVQQIDLMLSRTSVTVDWHFDEAIWRAAGAAFKGYARRRAQSGGKSPRRILTDFLIGAHAVVRGCTLLTLDRKHYESAFPGIRIESF